MIYYIIFLIVCAFVMFEYFRRYFKDLNTIIEVKEDNKAKDVSTEIKELHNRIDSLENTKELDSPLTYINDFSNHINYINFKRNEYTEKLINLANDINSKSDYKNKPTILDIDSSIPGTLKEYKHLLTERKYIEMILDTKGEDYIMNLEFLNYDETVSINVEDIDIPFYTKKRNSYHTEWQIKSMRNYYLKNKNQPKV